MPHEVGSAELPRNLKVPDRRGNAEIEPESFGIVVCRFVGTVPDILGLVWPSFKRLEIEDFRPDPSKFSGPF